MRGFEWDENKRNSNLAKHQIDFIDAISVFDDLNRIESESIRNSERRYMTIGIIDDVVILVVYTYRNQKRRLISARVASKNERELYFKLR